MKIKTETWRGFSCPQETFDTSFMDLVMTLHGAEIWRRFAERHHEELSERSWQLTERLSIWLASRASFEQVWDRAFGLARGGVGPIDPVAVAAEIGLRLAAFGMTGAWRARFTEPVTLRFADYRIPSALQIDVSTEDDRVMVRAAGNGSAVELVFERAGDGWRSRSSDCRREPGFELLDRRIGLFFSDTPQLGGVPGDVSSGEEVPVDEVAAVSREAIDLLAGHAPEYLTWVMRVWRGVGPIRSRRSLMLSGSESRWPGVITLSFPVPAAALAEMLVHECSHQYYHQLRFLGGVDDGSDPKLYYSPVKGTGRPIRKLLLAYHAFANVLIMYRRFQAAGVEDDGYCERNERDLIPQLRQLAEALGATPALTPMGRALVEPLAERIELSVAA